MPNRTDHTVKKRSSDRDFSIHSFAIPIASAVGGIGALTVMLSGGLVGIWLGAAILTTLIILHTALLILRVSTKSAPRPDQEPDAAAPLVTENDPNLILSVSKQGRIRGFHGRSDYLPGLKIGRILDELIQHSGDQVEASASRAEPTLSTLRLPSSTGELV